MKLLLENWKKFIKEEKSASSPFNLEIAPDQRILALSEPWKGFPSDIKQKNGDKPDGVWYGCGDSWLKWMKSEMPEWLDRVNYVYELEIDYAFVLTITNAKEFKDFEWEYWTKAPWRSGRGGWNESGPPDGQYEMIDWDLVDNADDGIEICPYLNEFRMSTSKWYSLWDVASGCLWNPEALLSEPKLLWQRSPSEEKEEEEDETPT
tara:strand:- start:1005 stop:1622 length:618 start_codon:yes stop_codon:yes gene_type:complete